MSQFEVTPIEESKKRFINEVNKLRKANKGNRCWYSQQIGYQIVHCMFVDTVIESLTHSGYEHSMVTDIKPTVKQFLRFLTNSLDNLR